MKPAYGRDDSFGIERSCGVQREFAGEAGAALRQTREELGLSVEEVAKATRIRRDYLVALEDGDCTQMPPKAYAVAYARTYAEYLDLDAGAVAEAMKAEYLFAEQRKMNLVKAKPARERRLPRGLVGAAAVIALCLTGMTWYGLNAPSRSAQAAPAPAPGALMRWSYEAAPDRSVWSGLAAQAGLEQDVWEASAPLPEQDLRPAPPAVLDH